MDLKEFLSQDVQKVIEPYSVICLQADAYPLLFCRQFVAHCARGQGAALLTTPLQSEQSAAMMASLQSTFLGTRTWYWLGSDEQLAAKDASAWHKYLAQYTGPNTLFFFTTRPMKATKSWLSITVPSQADCALFLELAARMGGAPRAFVERLYRFHTKIPLETAVMLAQYGTLLGKQTTAAFIENWLHELLIPEASLFSLSQALFARQSRTFFRQWRTMSGNYGAPFWIAFWAEQFWQAYSYVCLQKKRKTAEAQRVGYRLPFSFKNRDWHHHSLAQLQRAHHELYTLDFHLKNGGSEIGLDLFFVNVLSGG